MATTIPSIAVFDDCGPLQPSEPLELQPPKRRRGRPFGTKAKITAPSAGINACETAFLRAVVQGIAPKAAAERYLLHLEPMDARRANAFGRELHQRIHHAVLASPLRPQGMPLLQALDDAPPEPAAPVPAVLSLEEFAARFDEDMYGERELQEMYQEEVARTAAAPVPPTPAPAPVVSEKERLLAKLHTINWVQVNIAAHPRGSDSIALWLHTSLVAQLQAHGVLHLSDLVHWINLQGRRWYSKLSGVGRWRALRVTRWIVDHQEAIGLDLHPRIAAGVADAKPAACVTEVATAPCDAQMFGIVPLETLAWPLDLQCGEFRSIQPNTLKAFNDPEAVRAWFNTLREKSPATRDAYQRAIERLVLWAVVERRTPLSALSTADFMDFKEFLRNPPAHWCQRAPLIKSSQDWRPLRGPMKDASIEQTMSAISRMYRDWHASGYLLANAVASVRGSRRKEMKLDVMRSFSDEALRAIRETLYRMPDGPGRRRLRAALLLLQTAGLRRMEVVKLQWKHLERVRLDNQESDVWSIRFVGKGGRERVAPLQPVTYAALEDHYQDRLALIDSGALSQYAGQERKDVPLLSVLDERLAMGSEGSAGDMPSNARRSLNATGALSAQRLHGILKGFFRHVQSHDAAKNTDFAKASAHWLRHTFAHQTLQASGKNLPVVQQLLGHADISTTAIYVKADMSARVETVMGVKAVV